MNKKNCLISLENMNNCDRFDSLFGMKRKDKISDKLFYNYYFRIISCLKVYRSFWLIDAISSKNREMTRS